MNIGLKKIRIFHFPFAFAFVSCAPRHFDFWAKIGGELLQDPDVLGSAHKTL